MSASGDNAAPVIIKRKKVTGGGGHHGGAWKVAIACSLTCGAFAPVQIYRHTAVASKVVLTFAKACDLFRAIRLRTQVEKWRQFAKGVLNRLPNVAGI